MRAVGRLGTCPRLTPGAPSEQDEALDDLSKAVAKTKHIALAVNDELTLQTRLLVRSNSQ